MSEFSLHEQHAITYPISISGATSGAIVPAVPGKRAVMIYASVETAANNTIKFQSGATDVTGLITTAANTPIVFHNGGSTVIGCRDTNEALNLVLGTSGDATGWVQVVFQDNAQNIP